MAQKEKKNVLLLKQRIPYLLTAFLKPVKTTHIALYCWSPKNRQYFLQTILPFDQSHFCFLNMKWKLTWKLSYCMKEFCWVCFQACFVCYYIREERSVKEIDEFETNSVKIHLCLDHSNRPHSLSETIQFHRKNATYCREVLGEKERVRKQMHAAVNHQEQGVCINTQWQQRWSQNHLTVHELTAWCISACNLPACRGSCLITGLNTVHCRAIGNSNQ